MDFERRLRVCERQTSGCINLYQMTLELSRTAVAAMLEEELVPLRIPARPKSLKDLGVGHDPEIDSAREVRA